MKKLLIAASAVAMIAAAAPASAEIWAGADPGGVGVQVGPFGVGVGPRFGWRLPRGARARRDPERARDLPNAPHL